MLTPRRSEASCSVNSLRSWRSSARAGSGGAGVSEVRRAGQHSAGSPVVAARRDRVARVGSGWIGAADRVEAAGLQQHSSHAHQSGLRWRLCIRTHGHPYLPRERTQAGGSRHPSPAGRVGGADPRSSRRLHLAASSIQTQVSRDPHVLHGRVIGPAGRDGLAAIHAFFRYCAMEHPARLAHCQRVLAVPFKRTGSTHECPSLLSVARSQLAALASRLLDRNPHLVHVPRGPIVALGQPGYAGIATDGNHLERPGVASHSPRTSAGTVASGQPTGASFMYEQVTKRTDEVHEPALISGRFRSARSTGRAPPGGTRWGGTRSGRRSRSSTAGWAGRAGAGARGR